MEKMKTIYCNIYKENVTEKDCKGCMYNPCHINTE